MIRKFKEQSVYFWLFHRKTIGEWLALAQHHGLPTRLLSGPRIRLTPSSLQSKKITTAIQLCGAFDPSRASASQRDPELPSLIGEMCRPPDRDVPPQRLEVQLPPVDANGNAVLRPKVLRVFQ